MREERYELCSMSCLLLLETGSIHVNCYLNVCTNVVILFLKSFSLRKYNRNE